MFLLTVVDFLMITILTFVRWYLIRVLICIFLTPVNAEDLFMCLFTICMSFWRSVYSSLQPSFWLGCLLLVIEFYKVFIYFGNETLVGHIICKYFFPVCRLFVFSFFLRFPLLCQSLQIWLGLVCLLLFLLLLPSETDLRKHWYNLYQRIFCLFSLLGTLWSHVVSFRPSWGIFVQGVRECSNFIDLSIAANVQLSHHHLLKRLSSLQCVFLSPLSKINWL